MMNESFKFNLGDEIEDKLTGYKGVIISRTQWLTNCNTYGVRSQKLKDDKPVDPIYFDEPQLELVELNKIKLCDETKPKTGGPDRPVFETNRM